MGFIPDTLFHRFRQGLTSLLGRALSRGGVLASEDSTLDTHTELYCRAEREPPFGLGEQWCSQGQGTASVYLTAVRFVPERPNLSTQLSGMACRRRVTAYLERATRSQDHARGHAPRRSG